MTLNEFHNHYQYTPERKDRWRVLTKKKNGKYRGDCEDYALTVLFILCGESWFKFWKELIFGDAKLVYCTAIDYQGNRGGHTVAEQRSP